LQAAATVEDVEPKMRRWRIHRLALLVLASCGADVRWPGETCRLPSLPLVSPRPSARRTRNVVLVTVDGTRWQEIFGGADRARAPSLACAGAASLLPNLHALAAAGVAVGDAGAPVVSSGPNFVSLPGYREIVTGRASDGCADNECAPIDEPTLLDELARERPADELMVVASWERIARAASAQAGRISVSAGRHEGAGRERLRVDAAASQALDEGAAARAYPGWAGYRPDRFTMSLAREALRQRRPRFLWVALGDTDEYAHRGDYRGYLEALRAADRFVGELWQLLGSLGEYGAETTLVVTADHGRADDFVGHGRAPESARVWLIAAGGAIPTAGTIAARRTTRLRDIAPTLRVLLHLPPDGSPSAGAPIAELLPPSTLLASRRAE
jgi:hypothetical protein